ncbi:DedA family protein [Streptomyces sp. NPDC000070]|uniref:DedA family protein n=1 Tax=Streptomyces sp. NPDC000070 TaxID=3154240 RepID=UPI00332DBB22
MAWIQEQLAAVPAWLALLIVFLLPMAEPSLPLLGMLFPSQTALMASGVLAHHGALPLPAAIAMAVLGALAGNVIGHLVGRRWGSRLAANLPARVTDSPGYRAALHTVGTYSARAVLLGRFNAVLRTLVPVMCGAVGVPWTRFLGLSLLGSLLWAPSCVAVGMIAGGSWQKWGGSGVLAAGGAVLLLTSSLPMLLSYLGSRKAQANATLTTAG